jgi:DNA-binding beta-propeller fold protein YncE
MGDVNAVLAVRVIVLVLLISGLSFTARSQTGPPKGLLLVTNSGDKTLGIIDPTQARQVAVVPLQGSTGHTVAVSSDGKLAFVPIYGDSAVGLPGSDGSQISVVDVEKRLLLHTIMFGHPVRPYSAAIGPKDGLLYVTAELDDSVDVFDLHPKWLAPGPAASPESNRPSMIAAIPTGQSYSQNIAIGSDGHYGYVTGFDPGTIAVLDLSTRKLVATIPVARYLRGISISADGQQLFTSDPYEPAIAMVDLRTRTVVRWLTIAGPGYSSAPTPDGEQLLVAVPSANEVVAVDLSVMRMKRTIAVPASPREILIRPDGAMAYISCDFSAKVAVLDLKKWKLSLINVGHGPDGLAWDPEKR